jgi:hypothetical protein
MIPMLSSALAGLGSAGALASTAATNLSRISSPASSDPGAPDVASDFVTLSVAGAGVAVSVKLAQVAQENDKTLLDIMA